MKGDSLPESVCQELGLVFGKEESGDPEDSAREIVKELCRLVGKDIQMVVCFDQVEAIQRYPGDDTGVFAFGQAVQTLHDETRNVLLVSCIQSFFLEHLNQAMMKPNYDQERRLYAQWHTKRKNR